MVQTSVVRVLDASLNRAAEGAKALRHDLAVAATAIPSVDRHAARDTRADVGTTISTAEESQRANASEVCAASVKRTAQSLRSLEEYGKLVSADFAGKCESLRYRLYTLEKAINVGRSSRDRLDGIALCILMDGGDTPDEFARLAKSLVEAGVGMIQLRDKRLDDRELLERARMLVALTRMQPPAPPGVSSAGRREPPAQPGANGHIRSGTLAIVNDRVDIAATVQADGVHVGQDDLSVKDARTIVGPRMLIGVSTHNIEQARAAVLDGANYLGAGPTFASKTKSFDELAGLDYLRDVAAEIRLPTFAIGGISASNLADVLATGISRVAVSAAVTNAADPACAAQELLGMLSSAARTPLTIVRPRRP
jgi:thiamine-phosphate pyrophosphorylase